MRLSIALVVFRKEMLETLRDKRTLISLVLLPMLLYPLFALLMTRLADSDIQQLEAKRSRVAVWGTLTPELETALREEEKIELVSWQGVPNDLRPLLEKGEIAPPEPPPPADNQRGIKKKVGAPKSKVDRPDERVIVAAQKVLGDRGIDAILVPYHGFSEVVGQGGLGRIGIYYDSVWLDSDFAESRLTQALDHAREKLLQSRESARGLPAGFTTGIYSASRNVAPDERRVGKVLGSLMPMMLILMSLLGGFLRAADMTAGEKERGTMQTLLCAPVLPIEMIIGKFLTVFVVSLITALVNVVSMALTIHRLLPGEMEVPFGVHVLTFALLVPVTFLFSALFLAVASFARDFKDAQNLLTPLYLPVMLLSMLTSLPGMELTAATSFVPLLNVALLIKAVYLGDVVPNLVLFTLGSSTLFAGLALVFAARVFEREDVLLGSERGSLRELFTWKRQKGGTPSLDLVVFGFAAILMVIFYASLAVEKMTNKTAQLVGTQYGLMLLPPLVILGLSGASIRETMVLRLPKLRAVLGALLIGLSAGAVVSAFALRLVPVPRSFSENMSQALLLDGQPYWLLLVIVALSPAICEEALFRGFLFSGLLRAGPWLALIGSSLLFGLAHGSIYRMIPTVSLGFIIGFTRWKTNSIVPGAIIHCVNNGLAVTLLYYQPKFLESFLPGDQIPLWLGGVAALILGAGLYLVRSPREQLPSSA
ncbi:MAG TPA: ABC transporter permease subunit/CPBP intramembrane protease [Polyangium sp.]|nr:ABC transporter permease subunit/CPBP intramembrane protease [Polyangium sp.]